MIWDKCFKILYDKLMGCCVLKLEHLKHNSLIKQYVIYETDSRSRWVYTNRESRNL